MTRSFVSAVLLGATLLGGCTVGPNYHAPETAVPPVYGEPQQAVVAVAAIDPAHWWTAFGDAELTSLVERALKDNPDIAAAASRVRQARLQEIAAYAVGKPTVDATSDVTHVEFSKNAGFSSLASLFSGGAGGGGGSAGGANGGGIALPGNGITTYALGFDSSWELDLFGGGRRQVQGALARTDAAIWSGRDAAVTLGAEVAQAYFAMRLDQEQVAVIGSEVQRQRRSLQIAADIARVGLTAQVDTLRQQQQITSLEARLEPIRADIRVRIHALGILLGVEPERLSAELTAPLPALQPVPVVPAGLPSELLRRRPDVRAAERRLAAATADIGVAVADLYPKFNLTGMAEFLSTSLSTLIARDSIQASGVAGITFPLLDWGRRKATVGMRKEDREQAYLQYRTIVLGALRDVEDPLARLDAERRRNAALRRAVSDADRTARAVDAQYRTGLVAQNAPIDAQVTVLSAREQLVSSDAQLRQDTAALFKAIGGGWEEPKPAG